MRFKVNIYSETPEYDGGSNVDLKIDEFELQFISGNYICTGW